MTLSSGNSPFVLPVLDYSMGRCPSAANTCAEPPWLLTNSDSVHSNLGSVVSFQSSDAI